MSFQEAEDKQPETEVDGVESQEGSPPFVKAAEEGIVQVRRSNTTWRTTLIEDCAFQETFPSLVNVDYNWTANGSVNLDSLFSSVTCRINS